MKKLILLLITLAMFSSIVLSFGVVPADQGIMFEPGTTQEIKLKILNPDKQNVKLSLYAEGEGSKYVAIPTNLIELKGDERIITLKIDIPQDIQEQGKIPVKIVLRSVADSDSEQGTSITVDLVIIANINIVIPYQGKYLESQIFLPNIAYGKEANIAVKVTNLGTERIENVRAIVEILSPLNENIETLTSKEIPLAPKEEKILYIKWTPELLPGAYLAKSTVIYDGKNHNDQKEFMVGLRIVDIINIIADNFKLGEVNEFSIIIKNMWNQKLNDVWADVFLMQDNSSLVSYKTSSNDLESYETRDLKAYLDTKDMSPGTYTLKIVLNYLQQKKEKALEVILSINKAEFPNLGKVLAVESTEKFSILESIQLNKILIIILIISNALIVFKLVKDRKKK